MCSVFHISSCEVATGIPVWECLCFPLDCSEFGWQTNRTQACEISSGLATLARAQLQGTRNLVDEAKLSGIDKIVLLSTLPVDETLKVSTNFPHFLAITESNCAVKCGGCPPKWVDFSK